MSNNSNNNNQGRTNPGRLVTWATKFRTVAPNMFSTDLIIAVHTLHKKICTSSHAPSRRYQKMDAVHRSFQISGSHNSGA
jgi:hypothetical protein